MRYVFLCVVLSFWWRSKNRRSTSPVSLVSLGRTTTTPEGRRRRLREREAREGANGEDGEHGCARTRPATAGVSELWEE